MKLINTDGMAFIGPGSEWLWTAVSGLVLAVTFIAIWRRLRLARSASVRELSATFDREWDSERMLRHRLAILVAQRDGLAPEHFPDGSATALVNYREGLAQLVRSGDIDRRILHANYGSVCAAWWAILGPRIRWYRSAQDDPHDAEDFEWLAGIMAELNHRVGRPPFDEAAVGAGIGLHIAILRDRLRVEEALRTVTMVSPDTTPAPASVIAPATSQV